MAVSKANNVKSDKQAEQVSAEAKSDDAVNARESALSDEQNTNIVLNVGAGCTVIKDGGAYEKPGTLASVGVDDEEFMGTHCAVVTDPESNEHEHLADVIQVQSEQHARDFSAQQKYRRLYFCWLTSEAPAEEEQA